MSNTESFIEEVTEEVRKDQLYGYLRKYGWIAATAIVLVVGTTGYLEYTKARDTAAAQARGDAIVAALQADGAQNQIQALSSLPDGNTNVVVEFQKAAILADSGDVGGALAAYDAIASNASVSTIYSHLAALKAVMMRGADASADERRTALGPLANPGAPYRPLALEQLALVELQSGNREKAIEGYTTLLQEAGVSASLQQRALQMIVALGGEIPNIVPTQLGGN